MATQIVATWDTRGIDALARGGLRSACVRTLRKAGATALRDMRSEANKRIRTRKRIAGKYIARSLRIRRPTGSDPSTMSWHVELDGSPVPLVAYPHRQTKRGVSVEVNRGKRTIVKGAFLAVMSSGHEGVYKREGKKRLPIRELLGSRPVDALLHQGEADAVGKRGARSLTETFRRLFPVEVGKLSTPKGPKP